MKYELIFKTYYFILKIEIFTRKLSLKKKMLKKEVEINLMRKTSFLVKL